MKITMFATLAALAVGAMALPAQAAPVGLPHVAIATSPAVTQVACVWHHHRHWVARHVRPDGAVVAGHWVRRRVKVCD